MLFRAPAHRVYFGLTLTASLCLATVAHGAEDPSQIMKKAEASYQKASSFQGTLRITQSGKDAQGKPASMTSTQKISFKAPNLLAVEVTSTGTGSAAGASQGARIMKSNGKETYVYMPSQKQYMKQPAPPKIDLMQILGKIMPSVQDFSAKFIGERSVGGHPAFILEMKRKMPVLPANTPKEQKDQIAKQIQGAPPMEVAIEKGTYHLISAKIQSPQGSLEATFLSQTVNAGISPATFNFTPPAGATEFKQPVGGVPPRKP